MLRRLNVRTRLVAVIAVPLALLLAVAVPEALQRSERSADAGRAATSSEAVTAVSALLDALQGERTLSAARRAGAGGEVAVALRDQRARTDGALERIGAALNQLAALDPSVTEAVREARSGLDDLEGVRAESDAAESIVPWVDPFKPLLLDLLDVQEAAGAAVADLGLGNQLSLAALVARTTDAASAQAAQLAAAAAWGELRGDQVGIVADQRSDEAAYRTAYLTASPAALRTDRRAELARGAGTVAGRAVDQISGGSAVPSLGAWLDLSGARQQVFRDVETTRATEAIQATQDIEASSRRSSNGYLALAGTGLLLALGLALAAARSITHPLHELTVAADHLAEDRLPKLVDALRHPVDDDEMYLTAALEPIEVRSDDELGHLARAFNAVQSVAVDVAAEQSELLKKGISDLYVNLARRNQALIDRQIQLLDQLEAGEQDTQVLQHLYLLDHLATRMRRNAESLLILAGSESGPRRSKPIELVDVVRAALSEVEEYERVELGTMAAGMLRGPAVSDVAHLVAELLENATQFSPPDRPVRVDGVRTGGIYQLVISDRGVGMPQDQMDELNAILRDPPVTGLALGHALGCLVAARLAARHRITVRLRAGEHDGVTAYVILPHQLLVDVAEAEPDADPTVEQPAAPRHLADPPAADPWLADWEASVAPEALPAEAGPVVLERVDPAPVPDRLSEALPARSGFDAGIRALLDRERAASPVDPPVPVLPSGDGPAPLPRRVPGATAETVPAPTDAPAARRSPDEVRALLSRYRSGLQAGRHDDGPAHEEQP